MIDKAEFPEEVGLDDVAGLEKDELGVLGRSHVALVVLFSRGGDRSNRLDQLSAGFRAGFVF